MELTNGETSKEEEALALRFALRHLGLILFQPLLLLPLRTMVLLFLWQWFIEPTFGIASPSYFLLMGVLLTANFILLRTEMQRPNDQIKFSELDKDKKLERLQSAWDCHRNQVVAKTIGSVLFLGVAAIVHALI